MRIQQAGFDALRKQVPGVETFTEDRDRLIKFYGNGQVAVASFYRYTTMVLPPNTPADVAKANAPLPPSAATLVLEKRDGGWKIVHTHFSDLAPAN
jgi:SnoaL-like protein